MSKRKLDWHLLTAAAVLIGAVVLGAAQNIVFVRSLGTDFETTTVWVGLAVLAAVLKVRIPFTEGWRCKRVLVLTFVAAMAFDLLCAYGHGALSRGSKLKDFAAAKQARAETVATIDRLERELSAVPAARGPARPASVVKVALDAAKVENGCQRDETRNLCPIKLAPLKAELAAAESAEGKAAEAGKTRARLERELSAARDKLEREPLPAHPDPQAQWIAETFGIPEHIAASLQTFLGMAILELGVIAGALMAETRAPAPNSPATPDKPQPKQRTPPAPVAGGTAINKPAGAGIASALETLKRIAAGQLAAAGVTVEGGQLVASQTALALACGCSQPTMGRWLQELEAAGSIRAQRHGRVTRVEIL